MPRLYFKAPVSGRVTANEQYCDGSGTHSKCQPDSANPKDIAAPAGTNLMCYGQSAGSIGVGTLSSGCCSNCSGVPKNARYADFYRYQNGQGYYGTVLFGHVDSPKADGIYNNSSIAIGKVPAGCCPYACNQPGNCYGGPHSHFERRNGGGVVGNLTCTDSVTAGSTLIYYWDVQ